MADRDSERDRRVRELMSDASKKKDQLAVLGQSQAEIQDIQSELQNHLAMQQAQDAGRLQETGVMSQAAGMMMDSQGDQLQGQVAAMNPGTQAMMGKYGVKPKKSQSSSHNQNQSRVISKSGDITNIKNETITNNHTDIRVTQPAIPISQPVISVAGAQKKEDGTAKFKAWLSGMFAKQQNDAEIQKKEYRKKEWNLGRTTTRLMKRIENATASLGAKLDPKNMTSTLGGQIKWLLLIFGATMMAKFWKPTMKFLANLEGGFRTVFGLPMNDDLRNASSGTLSVIDQIKEFIGIKKGENESLIGGIGKVFMEGIDKLINKLKFWFEDRASALKEVEFPELKVSPIGIPGFDGLMDGLTGAFKGVAQYLGDIITVAMGGSKGKVKVEANKIARQAQEVFTNTSGKQTSAGDAGLVKGNGRSYMKDSDYDMFGNLKGNAASTQAMSESLISLFNDKSNKAHTAEIGTGVSQLFSVAKRNGQVVINPDLLTYLGLSNADIVTLKRNQQLRQEKYRIIGVKPTTDAERKELGAYTGNAGFWAGGVGGTLAGTLVGAGIGGFGGAIIGGVTGGYLGSAGGAAVDEQVKRWTTNGLYPKLVKADSQERGADGSMGVPKMMWTLTKEGADQVAAKFTSEMNNHDMDLTNKEFYDEIRKIEERKKRQNGVQGALTQNLQTNDLNVAQSQYDAYNKQWYENFESNDPNSKNMQTYGHYNAFADHMSGVFNSIGSSVSNGVRAIGNFVTSERLSGKQATSRSNYLIQTLMQKSGLTKEQAAGVAGNIMRESGFVTNKWGDHNTSVGIAQWHDDRITRYNKEYGAQGHLADASFEQQVDYLIWEAEKDGVMGKMRQTRSSAEAANTWERLFEKSQDYAKNGNRYRIEYSAKALNSFNDSSGSIDMSALQSQNASMATYYKGESPFKIEGGTSTVGGGNVIAWIGDSHSEFGLPGVVGNRLKSKFGCQYVWGAYRGYSAHSHLKNKPYHGVCSKDNKVNNFSEILNKKPGIIIVELGANDSNGVDGDWKTGIPKLIDTIKGNGAKVVWLTPLGYSVGAKNARKNAIDMNKSANQVREYILSRSDISVVDVGGFVNFYSCQATPWDKFVGNDGLHWNSTGYKMLGEWIGGVLTGVVSNPGFTSEDLEKQDGIFGAISENVGEFITNLADKIDGETYQQPIFSEDITADMTDAQKKVFNSSIDRIAQNEALNIRSWESLGAKSDNKGTYFQNGDIRTYVRTDEDHNGIFGLRQEDIAWVERVDSKGRPGQAMTDSEIEIASKAATYSVSSMFSDYPEKTKDQGYNDYMVDKNGKPLGFYIGEFKDLDSFKDPAPEDFKGKIRFWIFPTKDLKRWNMIGIGESRKCSLNIISETRSGTRYYGPIIYHKGARWFVPGTLPSEKKYTDYQPICYWLNVKLTPSAHIAALGLIDFLNTAGKIIEKDGKFYNAEGKELTKEELQKAKDYGIITKTYVESENTGDYIGIKDTIRAGFSQAMTAGKALDIKSFKIENYSSGIGIENTKEAREKYYNEHKDLFRAIDGTLYGPQNIKWGTVNSKGEISFYDNDKFKSTVEKEGEEGLAKNSEAIINYDTEQLAKVNGFVSREKMAKFIFGASNYTREGSQIRGSEKMTGIRGVRNIKSGSNNIPIQYTAFIKSDGTPYSYQVTKKQLIDSLKASGFKSDAWDLSDIKATSLSELDQAIINSLNKNAKSITDITNFLGNKTYKATSGNNYYSNKRDGMARLVLNKGKEVVSIRNVANGQEIVLEDGEVIKTQDGTFDFSWGKPTEDTTRWINDINNAIKLRNKQLKTQAINDSFEKSGMNSLYKSFAESANKGELKYKMAYGNYVATNTGDVFGIMGKDGKIKALNGGQAYEVAMNYFNQTGIREDFYRKALGSKTIQGKDYYEIESNGKKQRIQIDLSKDLSNFMDKGLSGLSIGQAQEFQNGKWVTLSGDANAEAIKNLRKPLDEMRKNQGFTNTLMKQFKDAMANKLSDAAKARIKQLNAATEQKAQQKQSNVYLEQIAKNGISKADLDALSGKIDNIKLKEQTEKQANESFTKLAENLKAKGQNLDKYTVVGDASRKYVIGADQIQKLKDNKVGNGDGILTAEEAAKGGTKIKATNKQGKLEEITVINEGGKYYIYNNNSHTYSGITVDGTLGAYEPN